MSKKSPALGASLLVAVSITLALSAPLAASAHNVVVDSSPHAGDVLTELPDAFSVTTNEPMLDLDESNGFAIRVQDAAGTYYGDGCLTVVDATMSAVPALGAPGEYTMRWQAVSGDGHTIDGEIPFTWQPASAAEPSPGSATPPVCGESATPEPTASANPPSATPDPIAAAPAASGIDLATVLWIGGALLAVGVAVAVAIFVLGRRKTP